MRLISWTILIAGLAGCGDETQVTQPLEALAQSSPNAQYAITKCSASLGGVASRGTAINNRGWVAGFSNLPGDNTRHAALWRDGSIRDLGTLGGPNCPACNSSVVWPGLNDQGTVVGIAETADLDPLGEEWSCTAFFPSVTGHICRGFVWENGVMQALPTLGGNQGFATGVNSRGHLGRTPGHQCVRRRRPVLQPARPRRPGRRLHIARLPLGQRHRQAAGSRHARRRLLQRSLRHQRAGSGGGRFLRRSERCPFLYLGRRGYDGPERSRRDWKSPCLTLRPRHQRCRADHG